MSCGTENGDDHLAAVVSTKVSELRIDLTNHTVASFKIGGFTGADGMTVDVVVWLRHIWDSTTTVQMPVPVTENALKHPVPFSAEFPSWCIDTCLLLNIQFLSLQNSHLGVAAQHPVPFSAEFPSWCKTKMGILQRKELDGVKPRWEFCRKRNWMLSSKQVSTTLLQPCLAQVQTSVLSPPSSLGGKRRMKPGRHTPGNMKNATDTL